MINLTVNPPLSSPPLQINSLPLISPPFKGKKVNKPAPPPGGTCPWATVQVCVSSTQCLHSASSTPNATEDPVCMTCIMLNETHKIVFNFLFHRFIEDRYKYMCEVAQSRAILSLGISCFKLKKLKPHKETKHKESVEILNVKVNTFNIVVLCLENFIVEPASLKFLVEHGFDFNKQYSRGVPYRRGDDQVSVYFLRRLERNLKGQQ